ncbi:MAG TPA: SRPBCC family protein [Gemmatimonadaceae bacterium]
MPHDVAVPAPPQSTHHVDRLVAAIVAGVLLGSRSDDRSFARSAVRVAAGAFAAFALYRSARSSVRRAGTRRRAAHLRFSFTVDRPVEQVFAFCADFENFPKFIGSLREVVDSRDGRSHWRARTPGGGSLEWDAVTTKFVTNSVIGWRSVPGSPVETTGVLRFSPENGGTCVRVAIDYRVSASGTREALAALVRHGESDELESEFRAFETQIPAAAVEKIAAEIPIVVTPGATPVA